MANLDLIIRRLNHIISPNCQACSSMPEIYLVAELRIELLSSRALLGEAQIHIDTKRLLSLSNDYDGYGEALTEMIFQPALREAWLRARGVGQVHLRVLISDPSDTLHALRWEQLRDPCNTSSPLAKQESGSLARQVLLDRVDELYGVTPPPKRALRALVVVAGPSPACYSLAQIEVAHEAEQVKTALGAIPVDLLADTTPGKPGMATRANLRNGLRKGPHILYLICHGKKTPQGTTLYLAGDDGAAVPISGVDLAKDITDLNPANRPLLAVLVACESADQQVLASVGPLLARAGVPAVIAMQAPISMDAAAKLTRQLLSELEHHGRIDRALAAARKEMGREWWVPVLWLGTYDGRLWEKGDIYENIPDSVVDEYVERKAEEGVINLLKQRTPVGLIYGMPGSGKSTLIRQIVYNCVYRGDSEVPFKDVVWVVGNSSRPVSLQGVLNMIKATLQPDNEKESVNERDIEKLLRRRRALLVIDQFDVITNKFDRPKLLNWLKGLPEPSEALIISRSDICEIEEKCRIGGMEQEEVKELISQYQKKEKYPKISVLEDHVHFESLYNVTQGNIIKIRLILALAQDEEDFADRLNRSSETTELLGEAWELLDKDAQHILLAATFFPFSARAELLQEVAELNSTSDDALNQLVDLTLLDEQKYEDTSRPYKESNTSRKGLGRYVIHQQVRDFAEKKIEEKEFQGFKKKAWEQYYNHYCNLLKKEVKRTKPQERYWNSLIRTDLDLGILEREKDNLFNILYIAHAEQHHAELVEMMMLFTHVLSRLDVLMRREYAAKAVKAANALGQLKDEAILRIDALGWILIELGASDEAEDEIKKGLRIAEELNDVNLKALAYAFLTRVSLERSDKTTTKGYLEKAEGLCNDCSPMIQRRIFLAAADAAFAGEDFKLAADNYVRALMASRRYGKERHGEGEYGLGVALLKLGPRKWIAARRRFIRLCKNEDCSSIDVVYGLFGLAQLAKEQGNLLKEALLKAEEALKLCRVIAPPDDNDNKIDNKLPTPGHRMYHQIEEFIGRLEPS